MYEEHDMLRRAATELMCNMVISEKVRRCLIEPAAFRGSFADAPATAKRRAASQY